MHTKAVLIIALMTMGFLVGCEADEEEKQPPVEENFIDHGFIPADVEIAPHVTPFQSATFHNGNVFVATTDGLWKNDLATKEWSRVGFKGMEVSLIYKHPYLESRLFAGIRPPENSTVKTLYISEDGGLTWKDAENPIQLTDGEFESYSCLAVRPGYPEQIYANMEGGAMIAVSLDGGMNWERMNYAEEQYFGYTSIIAFLPEDPNHLFQGSENPLDMAWLGRYDIDVSDPVLLKNFTTIIGLDEWENRRPNEMKSFPFEPQSLYVGQEGALSKVTGDTFEFIFLSEKGENFPYSYIQAIWVNPVNPEHIIFGGSVNSNVQPMSLYETLNEGKDVKWIENKLGFENPQVVEIVHTDSHPAIVLNDMGKKKVKLVLYNFN